MVLQPNKEGEKVERKKCCHNQKPVAVIVHYTA